MFGLGIDGITSFSAVPLRMIAALGAGLFVPSVTAVYRPRDSRLGCHETLPIYVLGGVQLLSLGLVGEYVAKVYLEVKRRPRYFVATTTRDREFKP
jgi:hypothetical protein